MSGEIINFPGNKTPDGKDPKEEYLRQIRQDATLAAQILPGGENELAGREWITSEKPKKQTTERKPRARKIQARALRIVR